MGRRAKGTMDEANPHLRRQYDGEAVLAELLAVSGSPINVEEVKSRIQEAQAEGEPAGELFPTFFEGEPRFPSPEVALLLYSNLFGLWDRIAAGGPVEPEPTLEGEERAEPQPPPPHEGEGPLSDEFVEAAWRYLADLPERELQRWSDRYENTQPELSEHVRYRAGDSTAAVDTADTLAFELWAMLSMARPGTTLPPVSTRALEATEGQSEMLEPALEAYALDVIEEAQLEEEEPLAAEDAPRIATLVRAVIRTLRAVY